MDIRNLVMIIMLGLLGLRTGTIIKLNIEHIGGGPGLGARERRAPAAARSASPSRKNACRIYRPARPKNRPPVSNRSRAQDLGQIASGYFQCGQTSLFRL